MGHRSRQEGIHPRLVIATFLDPRVRTSLGMETREDQDRVESRVLELIHLPCCFFRCNWDLIFS